MHAALFCLETFLMHSKYVSCEVLKLFQLEELFTGTCPFCLHLGDKHSSNKYTFTGISYLLLEYNILNIHE